MRSISTPIDGARPQPLSTISTITGNPIFPRIKYSRTIFMRKAVYVSPGLAIALAITVPAVTTGPADAKILPALDRLTLGPRPAHLEQVRESLPEWVGPQLNH